MFLGPRFVPGLQVHKTGLLNAGPESWILISARQVNSNFRTEPERVARSQRQAEVLATLKHPDGASVNAEARFSRGVDYHPFALSPVCVQTSEAFVKFEYYEQ